MALVTTDFNINITPGAMPPVVHVSEYDIGRSYTVGLIGENNDTFTIPTGTTATIEGTLNGVVGFSVPATISNNKVAFTLTESMTAYAGKAWCKIKLTLNDEPIQTCAFIIAVDRAGVESETVIGAPGFDEQIKYAVDEWLYEHGGGNVSVAIKDMDGYKIAPTGTILVGTAGTQFVSAPIPVTAGEKLRITASSKYGNSLYALYDASGAMVDNQTAAATAEGTAVKEMSVTVHADAVTLRVAWDKAVTDTAYAVIRVGGQTAPDGPLVGVKCAVIGDSIIEAAAAPNAGLVELMAASTGAEITNLGVGGTGWMRGQEEGTAYYQRVADIPADTQRVLLYGSGNDRELTLGDPADTGTETVCGCVNATLDAVYAHVPTAWVGIIAPAPWQYYPPYESGNAMELLAHAIGAICRRRGVPYLDLYHSSGLRPWDDAFRELAYSNADGIHPNATGYGMIAPQCSAFLVGGGTAQKLAEELPDKLPNPNALTFTGAVTGSYDGSAPLSVEIPSGGGTSTDGGVGTGAYEFSVLASGTIPANTITAAEIGNGMIDTGITLGMLRQYKVFNMLYRCDSENQYYSFSVGNPGQPLYTHKRFYYDTSNAMNATILWLDSARTAVLMLGSTGNTKVTPPADVENMGSFLAGGLCSAGGAMSSINAYGNLADFTDESKIYVGVMYMNGQETNTKDFTWAICGVIK